MSTFIEVKNLTKVFNGSDKRFTALNGVSFSVEKGELVLLAAQPPQDIAGRMIDLGDLIEMP